MFMNTQRNSFDFQYVYRTFFWWLFYTILRVKGTDCIVLLFCVQIMQTVGFLGRAFFLTQLSHINNPAMAVLCMTCSQVWILISSNICVFYVTIVNISEHC